MTPKRQRSFIVGVFLLVGIGMVIGVSWAPADTINGPRWLAVAAASVFVFGALILLIREYAWSEYIDLLHPLLAALMITVFFVIGLWVGLGPGPRDFGFNGRAAFTISAGLTGLMAFHAWKQTITAFVRAIRGEGDPNLEGTE